MEKSRDTPLGKKKPEKQAEYERVSKAFAKVLKEYRNAKGEDYSQMDLAEDSGYHFTYISQLERGIKMPSLATLLILARHLDVSPENMIKAVQKKLKKK